VSALVIRVAVLRTATLCRSSSKEAAGMRPTKRAASSSIVSSITSAVRLPDSSRPPSRSAAISVRYVVESRQQRASRSSARVFLMRCKRIVHLRHLVAAVHSLKESIAASSCSPATRRKPDATDSSIPSR
jgi:hypothetical protein